jgi:hypothetical protein
MSWIIALCALLAVPGCGPRIDSDSLLNRYNAGRQSDILLDCTTKCHNSATSPALDPLVVNGEGTAGKHILHVSERDMGCEKCHSDYVQDQAHMNGVSDTVDPAVRLVLFNATNPRGVWVNDMGAQSGSCAATDCHKPDTLEWYGTQGWTLPGCGVCHVTVMGEKRQVLAAGGDFVKSSHHVVDYGDTGREVVTDADCLVCHDMDRHMSGVPRLSHKDNAGEVIVYRAGETAVLDPFCLSCHDAGGAATEGANALSPFSDGNILGVTPIEAGNKIDGYWTSADTAHRVWGVTCAGTGAPGNGCHGDGGVVNAHGSGAAKLQNHPKSEDNCYPCHGGASGQKNIEGEFAKQSVHPVSANDVHFPSEDLVNPVRHVECVDCHNPHAATAIDASVPDASGALKGVRGVASSGSGVAEVSFEYELCFRCHADSTVKGAPRIMRQFVQTNTRLETSPTSLSYHPIAAAGRNPDVPSLISPYSISSIISCSDCHNNNQGPRAGGTGPDGPHGSIYTPLLERKLVLGDGSGDSSTTYALCYKCHSRSSIRSNASFEYHRKHLDEEISCVSCHDPHGVIGVTHLINFNTNVVTPVGGRLEFNDDGRFHGTCYLSCHDEEHDPETY